MKHHTNAGVNVNKMTIFIKKKNCILWDENWFGMQSRGLNPPEPGQVDADVEPTIWDFGY